MKKGYLKLAIMLPILILFYAFFIVFPQFNSRIGLMIYTIVMAFFVYFFIGYENNKEQYLKNTMLTILAYAAAYFIIIYLIGLAVGFVANTNSLKVLDIIKNIIPIVLIIGASELSRFVITKKGLKFKSIYWLAFVLFVIIDVLIDVNTQTFIDMQKVWEFIIKDILPSISKNFLFFYITSQVGFKPVVVYSFIFDLTDYILPIFPDINEYLQAGIAMVAPVILYFIIHAEVHKKI